MLEKEQTKPQTRRRKNIMNRMMEFNDIKNKKNTEESMRGMGFRQLSVCL